MNILKNKVIKSFIAAFLLIFPFIPSVVCQAGSASITLSTKEETVTAGDELIVNIELSSEDLLGDFEAYITYNSDVLEFESEASFIAGGEGLLKLTDTNVASADNNRKYAMKFKAKAIGNSEIAIKDKSAVYDYESGSAMSLSSNHLNISVEAEKTASDNNNLKSLKVNPGTLSPEFDKDTAKYSVTVNSDVEKLIVSTITEDKNANVTLDGNENLKVGENKIVIKVKAESGDVKEYIINVTREEEKNNETNEINEEDETDNINDSETSEYNNNVDAVALIGKVSVTKDGENLYLTNGFKYQIMDPGESVEIPEGYTQTTIILDGTTVTAYTLENDLDNDFILLYAENGEGEASFYQYDRKEGTIQRYVKNNTGDNKVVFSNEMMNSNEYKNKLLAMGIVIAVLGSVCIIMSVVLIRIFLKNKEEDKE